MSGPVPAAEVAVAAASGSSAAPPVLLPAGDDGVELVARFFRALGDPARLRLLEFLLPGQHTVTECVAHVGLSQGRVSAHLACLAGCGYVQARRQGRNAFYRVADPRVADLVVLARSMAADNAAALAACVQIGPATVPGQDPAAGP
jgi:ArsR family transcriptional regulator, cadmium/lead-responsive transcriptional repressor